MAREFGFVAVLEEFGKSYKYFISIIVCKSEQRDGGASV
jgi:hypothetical protein